MKNDIISLLEQFTIDTKEPIVLIIVGAMALPFYGVNYRNTLDIDAEVLVGDVEKLYFFLKQNNFESDISQNINGWSIISIPPGYRDRAKEVYKSHYLTIKILDPYDYIIMKLRRGTNQDIEDALVVANSCNLSVDILNEFYEKAIKSSIKDTALFNFKKIYKIFIEKWESRKL